MSATPLNWAQSLVPVPKVDQASCILVRLSPGTPENAWLYSRLIGTLDGKAARELLAGVARWCDVPRPDVVLWKREEVVTLGFQYAMQANRFVAMQDLIFDKLGIAHGTLRAHYLNEDEEPAYLVRVGLSGDKVSDELAHRLLEVHFHFSRVAELGRIALQPANPLRTEIGSGTFAAQDAIASFSFRDEENLVQKLEMLRNQGEVGPGTMFDWEVVHIGHEAPPAVPPMFVFGAPTAQPVRRSPRRKAQSREAYSLENGFEGQSLSSEALARLPQMERIGSPSNSQSSQSLRGRGSTFRAAVVPDDARSYASFQSTAFSVRSGFTVNPTDIAEERVERSPSPSPGYEGGEHEAVWKQRLRARRGA